MISQILGQLIGGLIGVSINAAVLYAILRRVFSKTPGYFGVLSAEVLTFLGSFAIGFALGYAGAASDGVIIVLAIATFLIQAALVNAMAQESDGSTMGYGTVLLAQILSMIIFAVIGGIIYFLIV